MEKEGGGKCFQFREASKYTAFEGCDRVVIHMSVLAKNSKMLGSVLLALR